MTSKKLNDADIKRLKLEIWFSLGLSFLFFAAIILVLSLIGFIVWWLFSISIAPGFGERLGTAILMYALMFIPFVWKSLLIFLDIIIGSKVVIETTEYTIVHKKADVFLVVNEVKKRKIKIPGYVLPLIDKQEQLLIEYASKSKELLFISNGIDNMLDIAEQEQ